MSPLDTLHGLIAIAKYGAALAIVGAGACWAFIWLLTPIPSAKPALGTKDAQPVSRWSLATWTVTALYAGYYYIYSMIVGGTIPTHPSHDGKYWLLWSGKSTEVSRSVYVASEVQEGILAALFILSLFIASRPTKRRISNATQPTHL